MWPKDYYINCIGLRKFVLGLKGEHEWDLLGIHYANLFEWWKNVGILDILRKNTICTLKPAGKEKDSIF